MTCETELELTLRDLQDAQDELAALESRVFGLECQVDLLVEKLDFTICERDNYRDAAQHFEAGVGYLRRQLEDLGHGYGSSDTDSV